MVTYLLASLFFGHVCCSRCFGCDSQSYCVGPVGWKSVMQL